MGASESGSKTRNRPNIVYVHSDGVGRNLGCYGRDVDTPNIDAFAADGVQFDSCFATAPYCSPSRASVMTGCYPHRHGVMGHIHRGWDLDTEIRTLPRLLRDAGYATYLFGKQSAASSPSRLGYDEAYDESSNAPDVASEFESRIDIFDDDGPVFASVGVHEPHSPLYRDYVPDEVYDRYDPESVTVPGFLPDTEAVREDLAPYKALLSGVVDPAFGRIRDALEAAGVAGETLLVFTTDHGMAAPGAKGNPTDAGLETALLVHHPELERGVRRDDLLSNVDVFPTLLAAAGEAAPGGIDGRSFYPLLTGDDYEPRDRIFAEKTFAAGKLDPFRAIRTRRFKYVQNYANRARGRGGTSNHFPEEECYDLRDDPHEEENLASNRRFGQGYPVNETPWQDGASGPDPDYLDDITALQSALHEWMTTTDDPLGDGHVPLPTHDSGRIR